MTTSLARPDESVESLREIAKRLLGVREVALERLDGGQNGRVYRVTASSRSYALKTYFRHAADSRARMETEFASLTFLRECGERCIPAPLAADGGHACAVYEWVEGEVVAPGRLKAQHIDAATAFLSRLAALARRPEAAYLRSASEACFSGRALVDVLHRRLALLLAQTEYRDLAGFLHAELSPAINAIATRSGKRLGEAFDRDLALRFRTLSPSDFGFHNALLRPDGTLIFLDMEYFGWDDPVKTISDFVLHPGMTIPPVLKQAFVASMLREFPEAAGRLAAFYPLFGLKWCLILLNEFLPAHLARRRFAGMSEHDIAARQNEQLAKARNILCAAHAGDERFPYGD